MEDFIHLPDTFISFGTLKDVLNAQGYVVYKSVKMPDKELPAIGRLAKGMNLDDIARKHGLTESYMTPEFEKGVTHEYEHTTERSIAEAIALDHLFENPKYYTMLDAMENRSGGMKPFPASWSKHADNSAPRNSMARGGTVDGRKKIKSIFSIEPPSTITKRDVFSYWLRTEGINPHEYIDPRVGERNETQMGEDAQRHFNVSTDGGDSEIEQDIFEWAVDYNNMF